ncbi:MAG: glycosyltransferase [Spirochaetales bacterium]|nr:glycosyltransferase [Spirochaetales bacterium]
MKILHINTTDTTGGAAIAAMRLHRAMLKNGIDSDFLCYERNIADDEHILSFSRDKFLYNKAAHFLSNKIFKRKLSDKPGYFSSFHIGTDIMKITDLSAYDVIYLHWINGSFINLKGLETILRIGKPVYWFMHDMFPITAGCHYSFDCSKYQTNCQRCPYMKHPSSNDYAAQQFKKKKKLYSKYDNLNFIAPSVWLCECVKKSQLTKNHNVYHIQNLLDDNIFKPTDKSFARQILNIPMNKKIILFGAQGAVNNPYKGFDYILDALNILSQDNAINQNDIELMIFGSAYNDTIAKRLPYHSHFIGFLHDEISLNLLYNAADIFCIPSLAENFANTVLEAVHCHIPIVGFNVGGIPDVVNDKTGYLARYKDSQDLAYGIKSVLFGDKQFDFSYLDEVKPDKIVEEHKQLWGGI